MKVTVIVFFVHFTYMRFGTNSSPTNVCSDERGETCCSGYYERNGTCLECFGAFGTNCSLPCADASYGYQCKNTCTCSNNEVCDKYAGCIRKDCFGEKGENCSIPCEIPNYGYNCESVCSCKKNEVCNKYFGCIPFDKERESNRINDQLILLIGFGSTTLSLSLIFVGVMFYRWRIYIQRNFPVSEKNKGFQTNVLSISNNEEIQLENYVDVRESTMLEVYTNTCTRESVDYRRNSAEYNHLFGLTNVNENSVDNYSTVDARCRQKGELVAFSEFPGDDCYVSMSKNAKRSNRLSKSCSDLRTDLPGGWRTGGSGNCAIPGSVCPKIYQLIELKNKNIIIHCAECFGASGSNCSQSCLNATYRYQCRKKCSCNHNEVCNKYVECLQIGVDIERTEGFDDDSFSPPSDQEINTENYFDVRESRMLGASV